MWNPSDDPIGDVPDTYNPYEVAQKRRQEHAETIEIIVPDTIPEDWTL